MPEEINSQFFKEISKVTEVQNFDLKWINEGRPFGLQSPIKIFLLNQRTIPESLANVT